MQSGSTSQEICRSISATRPSSARAADPTPSKQLSKMTFSPTVWKMDEVFSGFDLAVGGSPVLSGITGSTHPVTPCCPYLEGGFQSEPHVSFCQVPLSSPLLRACQELLPLSCLSAGDVLHGLGVLVYGAVR